MGYTLEGYTARVRARERGMVGALCVLSALLCALVIAAPPGWLALVLALSLAVGVATWMRPALGVAAVLAAALLFEQFDFSTFRPITRSVPFFESLSGSMGIGGVPLSPFEIALIGVAALTIAGGMWRRVRWQGGVVLRLVALFALSLVMWLGYGLLRGGSVSISVWQLRGLAYFVALVFLTSYAVRDERDVRLILATGAVVVTFKALEALWSYAVLLRYDLSRVDALTSHEDAVFMAWMIVLLAVSLAYKSMPRVALLLGAALPFTAMAFVATDRRAAYVALAAGLLVLALLMLTDPGKRKLVGWVAPTLAIVFALVLAAGWNGSGAFARPAQAIRSTFEPQKTADAQSNYYRRAEEVSLVMAIRRSPFVGQGFGHEFVSAGKLAKIEFQFAESIAHNQIIWLWANMGGLGFAVFWMMVGGIVAYGAALFRAAEGPLAKTVAATVICALIMQVLVSYVDMQLTFARNMTFLGVLVALLPCVARLEEGEAVARLRA